MVSSGRHIRLFSFTDLCLFLTRSMACVYLSRPEAGGNHRDTGDIYMAFLRSGGDAAAKLRALDKSQAII
ncbi:MAG: hypothetical protein ACRED3_17735, partial [Bradyrhizobium sp.]